MTAKKFLASPFGIFSLLCLAAVVMFAGNIPAVLVIVVLDVIVLLFLYPLYEALDICNRIKQLVVVLGCIAFITGLVCWYAYNLHFTMYTSKNFRLAMSTAVIHVLTACAIAIYKAVNRYRNQYLYTERRPSENVSAWTEDDEYSPAISIAEGFCNMLEKRGFERFLMRDFTTSTFLSYGDFADRDITRRKLQALLLDILRFLELPDVIALVIEYVAYSGTQTSQAGTYSRTPHLRTITLKIRDYYGPNNAVAILCHECTHYFMEYNRLNWNDTDLNEQRTDIAANMIGFNRIMTEGYKGIDTLTYSPCLKAGDSGINKPCLPKQVLRVLLQWLMPQPYFLFLLIYLSVSSF
ncbi:MAG: hypothetical protein IJS39_13595 [Synergistaceae bacterium]|nr:hypothetical protein [Synergistaceae bacterium]